MRRRVHFTTLLIVFAWPTAIAVLQLHGKTESGEDHCQRISQSTSVAHKQSVPPITWNLKYKSGSFQLRSEQWLRGEFVADGLKGQQHGTPILSIVSDQIRAIYFDPKAEKDSGVAERISRSGCGYALNRMPGDDFAQKPERLIVWIASPGAVLRGVERLNHRYPVRIGWEDSGVEKELILTVNQCEYASFLASLRQFVGARWNQIGHDLP